MTRLVNYVGAVAVAVAAAIAVLPALARADDKDVIDYRQHIMKTLDEQSGALGMVLSTAIPGDNFQAHLDTIALAAATALKSFEAKVPGGESKPEVWANWADFSKRMNTFAEATAGAAKLSREKGREAVMTTLLDVLTCKDCHDIYRNKK